MMLSTSTNNIEYLNGGVENLHGNPIFLPYDPYIETTIARVMLYSMGLYGCHIISYFMFKVTTRGKTTYPIDRPNVLSYYFVHLLAAVVLGGYGLYVYPNQPTFDDTSLDAKDKISNFVEMISFGELQIAYQIWSLPAGIFFVKEPYEMILHHTIVIFLGIVVSCFTNGFRYYAPFFFGIVELSSIPLSIMNIFKSDKSLSDKYPQLNLIVSLIFAITFLYIRNFLLLQTIWDFSKSVMTLMTSCKGSTQSEIYIICMIPYVGTLILSALLTSLQVIWGYKVVMKILKTIGIISSRKKTH